MKRIITISLIAALGFLLTEVSSEQGLSGGTVRGRVTEAVTDAPVAYAPIMIRGSQLVALTDSSGEYAINEVPPGLYTLVAVPIGYAPDSVEGLVVSADSATIQDFVLKQVKIDFVQRDSIVRLHERPDSEQESGRRLVPPDSNAKTPPQTKREDIDYGNELADRFPELNLRSHDSEDSTANKTPEAIHHSGTGKLWGTVTDATTGEPILGAGVAIHTTRMGSMTGPDGRFIVVHVPVGVYTIHAEAAGYYPDTVSNVVVSSYLSTSVNFALKPMPPQPIRFNEPNIIPEGTKNPGENTLPKPKRRLFKDTTEADSGK
ncbi:MAG: carboxypeptidase-like regulatory domain-containing protein [bacterium]